MNRIDVVFVHGLLSSRRAWLPMTKLLSKDPELPGLRIHFFEYASQLVRFRPDRRIPHLNDIADRLRTYLRDDLPADARLVVLVSHSQGGLIVQRFLARTLAAAHGHELAPIRRVVMFACPNSGSQFLGSLRKLTLRRRSPQERELRPLHEGIIETHNAVIRGVLQARERTATEWPIPVSTYAGISDNIVPPVLANWTFTMTGVLPGDHFSVIRPSSPEDSCYRALKKEIQTAAEEPGEPEIEPAASPPRNGPTRHRSRLHRSGPHRRAALPWTGRTGPAGSPSTHPWPASPHPSTGGMTCSKRSPANSVPAGAAHPCTFCTVFPAAARVTWRWRSQAALSGRDARSGGSRRSD